MGKAIGTLYEPQDLEACTQFFTRMNPGVPVPPFGNQNQWTIVIRDDEDRNRILGIIHAETATEVRHMSIDPQYENASMAATIAYNSMEWFFRLNRVTHYYATVPKGATRIQRFYRGEKHTTLVDEHADRFLKVL